MDNTIVGNQKQLVASSFRLRQIIDTTKGIFTCFLFIP